MEVFPFWTITLPVPTFKMNLTLPQLFKCLFFIEKLRLFQFLITFDKHFYPPKMQPKIGLIVKLLISTDFRLSWTTLPPTLSASSTLPTWANSRVTPGSHPGPRWTPLPSKRWPTAKARPRPSLESSVKRKATRRRRPGPTATGPRFGPRPTPTPRARPPPLVWPAIRTTRASKLPLLKAAN